MRNSDTELKQSYLVEESGPVKQATTRLKKILDAKYEAANIPKIVRSRHDLSINKRTALKQLLEKYGSLFEQTLEVWRNKQVHLTLKKDAQPYHA